ncbi:MAG: hypothetical protein M3271_09090 [Actinomycetota bacterium]|nr:hypothetical protein [Actinomycetota bacterium]
MIKKVLSLSVALVVIGAGWAGAAERGEAPRDGCANHTMPTFRVDGHALKDRYRVGQTARVAMRVVRSADPMVPQASAAGSSYERPVSGAYVGVMVVIDGMLLAGAAITDEDGSAIVEIEIDRPVRPGWAVAGGRAWKDLVSDPCPITEEGTLRTRKLFRIVGRS